MSRTGRAGRADPASLSAAPPGAQTGIADRDESISSVVGDAARANHRRPVEAEIREPPILIRGYAKAPMFGWHYSPRRVSSCCRLAIRSDLWATSLPCLTIPLTQCPLSG